MDTFRSIEAPQWMAEALPFEQLVELLADSVEFERVQLDNQRWAKLRDLQARRASEKRADRLKTAAQRRADHNASIFFDERGAA